MMFGQVTNGGPNAKPWTWHVLRPEGAGWTTVCTASTARPGLAVINLSTEPGPVLCRLARCQAAVADWRQSRLTDEAQLRACSVRPA
jgi:hypothetical protein